MSGSPRHHHQRLVRRPSTTVDDVQNTPPSIHIDQNILHAPPRNTALLPAPGPATGAAGGSSVLHLVPRVTVSPPLSGGGGSTTTSLFGGATGGGGGGSSILPMAMAGGAVGGSRSSNGGSETANYKVFVRIRPFLPSEEDPMTGGFPVPPFDLEDDQKHISMRGTVGMGFSSPKANLDEASLAGSFSMKRGGGGLENTAASFLSSPRESMMFDRCLCSITSDQWGKIIRASQQTGSMSPGSPTMSGSASPRRNAGGPGGGGLNTAGSLRFPRSSALSAAPIRPPLNDENGDIMVATQADIFEACGNPVVEAVLDGYNACVLAYGQTSSGKTHTMIGNDTVEGQGLIPRICHRLLQQTSAGGPRVGGGSAVPSRGRSESATSDRQHNSGGGESIVDVAFFEIYNEKILDLLDTTAAQLSVSVGSPLASPSHVGGAAGGGSVQQQFRKRRVRNHPIHGVFVEGLVYEPITSWKECKALIDRGNTLRHTSATRMNDVSSRSHAIFQLRLLQTELTHLGTVERHSTLYLADLAGSERLKQSETYNGERFRESTQINQSLTTLRRVIDGLIASQAGGGTTSSQRSGGREGGVIPYRESILTWVLSESLGGNAKTCMIATLCPHPAYAEESFYTLQYAHRAKRIVNRVERNEDNLVRAMRELELAYRNDPTSNNSLGGGSSDEQTQQLLQKKTDELAALEEQLKAAREKQGEADRQLDALQNQVSGLSKRASADQRELVSLKQERDATRRQLADATTASSKEVEELRAAQRLTQRQLLDAENQYAEIRDELSKERESLAALADEHVSAKETLKRQTTEIDQLRALLKTERDTAAQSILRLTNANAALEADHNELADHVKELLMEHETLQEQHQRLKQQQDVAREGEELRTLHRNRCADMFARRMSSIMQLTLQCAEMQAKEFTASANRVFANDVHRRQVEALQMETMHERTRQAERDRALMQEDMSDLERVNLQSQEVITSMAKHYNAIRDLLIRVGDGGPLEPHWSVMRLLTTMKMYCDAATREPAVMLRSSVFRELPSSSPPGADKLKRSDDHRRRRDGASGHHTPRGGGIAQHRDDHHRQSATPRPRTTSRSGLHSPSTTKHLSYANGGVPGGETEQRGTRCGICSKPSTAAAATTATNTRDATRGNESSHVRARSFSPNRPAGHHRPW